MLVLVLALLLTPAALAVGVWDTLAADTKAATLAQLINTSGLDKSVIFESDVTIFAPTVDAFAKLPQADLDALLADTSKLADLLKYYIVPGVINTSDIMDDMLVTALNGDKIRLNVYSHENTITANGAKIISADNVADTSLIHFIDQVIMPRPRTIVEIIALDPDFSILLKSLGAATIAHEFLDDNLTLFAPTNAAFAKLPTSDLDKLMANPEKMEQLLEYHVITHTLYSAGIWNHEYERTIDSTRDRIHIRKDDVHGLMINNAKLTVTDIQAKNGVVHKIDHVIIPVRIGFWLRNGKMGRK